MTHPGRLVTPETLAALREEVASMYHSRHVVGYQEGRRWIRLSSVLDIIDRFAALPATDASVADPRLAALLAALADLLWWSEWMQRDDWATADVAATQPEASRRLDLLDDLRDHESRARWLRAALAAFEEAGS